MLALLALLGLLGLLGLTTPAAAAADRVALVIGMGNYTSLPALDNPVRDAITIADTLEEIGFDVTSALDVPLGHLIGIMSDFAFDAETADLALIYFAGHGIQVQGENFLLPIDAVLSADADGATHNRQVQRQSVSLRDLLRSVDPARKMRIVILDSCRDNPFGGDIDHQTGTRSAGSGLAPPSPDRGTLVAFAARDGQVALDGTGQNSPFAGALADKLRQPGLEISLMFRQVRDDVLRLTDNQQEPHTYGSLSGVPFYIAGPGAGQNALPVADPVAAWSALRPEDDVQLAALAEEGDARSLVGLAYKRLNPAGEFRPDEAVALFQRAADAGSPVAQFELAKHYEMGIGVEPDPVRALEMFRAAADQDFPEALNDLGFLYYQGGLGLPVNRALALEYFERAADQRHSGAQFNFAALIDDGLVAGKGPQDAAEYLYAALRAGNSDVLKILETRSAMFKLATRQALQKTLEANGFYSGAIDGAYGPGTRQALRRAYGQEE